MCVTHYSRLRTLATPLPAEHSTKRTACLYPCTYKVGFEITCPEPQMLKAVCALIL
jgi:hypothetical protein